MDCDNDPASEGWTNWELAAGAPSLSKVKQEKRVFTSLRPVHAGVIVLDSPSPVKRACIRAPPNPDSLPGLFQDAGEEDGMPRVGDRPDDALEVSGGAGFRDVCLLVSLQRLGLPVMCEADGPFSVSFGNMLLQPFGVQLCHHTLPFLPDGKYIVHDAVNMHFFALQTREGFTVKKDGDFDSIGGSSPQTYTCPLDKCICEGCSGSLIYHLSVDAVLYDLNGPVAIVHEQKNCTSRSCRASYGYNYRWENGDKVNVLGMDDFQDNILFVNSKKAFSLKYLQYHEELLFRGHLSSAAVSCAYHTVYADSEEHIVYNFDKLHASALFYYMAIREFQVLGLHKNIVIDQEIKDAHLDMYDSFCHSSVFPPAGRHLMKTVVLDGNQKVKMHCDVAPMKRAGRPRKSEHTTGQYHNGWMLGCDPKSGRIISLQVMHEPENNDVACLTVEKVLWLYPKLDCIVYDRACAFKPFATSKENLNQIDFYIVDGFHAHMVTPALALAIPASRLHFRVCAYVLP